MLLIESSGSAVSGGLCSIKIGVHGIHPDLKQEFEVTIDTGFTGFLLMLADFPASCSPHVSSVERPLRKEPPHCSPDPLRCLHGASCLLTSSLPPVIRISRLHRVRVQRSQFGRAYR